MSRYIDQDKVLEYIIFGVVGKDITCGELKRAIESLPAIEINEDTDNWTPVSEGLPKKNGNYIISLEDAVDTFAIFFNGKWFMLPVDSIARQYGEYEVIAWRPFPKPYKKSEDE